MQNSELFDCPENATGSSALGGFRYQPDLVDPAHEAALLTYVRALSFREFEFHGFLGKRRVISFGWRYEYSGRGSLQKTNEMPAFLRDLRTIVAKFAQVEPGAFEQALVTEYQPGAGIGWHRDKAVFGEVMGVSLLAPCVLRFRRVINVPELSKAKSKWERVNVSPNRDQLTSWPALRVSSGNIASAA